MSRKVLAAGLLLFLAAFAWAGLGDGFSVSSVPGLVLSFAAFLLGICVLLYRGAQREHRRRVAEMEWRAPGPRGRRFS